MALQVAVIGGGAAGFFGAINIARMRPQAVVTIYEKSSKLLSKVKISGGGRCNVTHHCFEIDELIQHYPRGAKWLRTPFQQFSVPDTIQWFQTRNVILKTEKDGRIFPISDDSQTIIDCFLKEAQKYCVNIQKNHELTALKALDDGSGFELTFNHQKKLTAHVVIVTIGGHSKTHAYDFLKEIGHTIVPPVPSLFTFNIPNNPITNLRGISLPEVTVRIQNTKWEESGPFLITHWGFSGPAVLKLSAWAARQLADIKYEFQIALRWISQKEHLLRQEIELWKQKGKQKTILNRNPLFLPMRLWEFLLYKSQISPNKLWGEISIKDINRLVHCLTNDVYQVKGKTTFKEEFVTCGGVMLQEVDPFSMQSKLHKNLYFAGEVLDIDGITGGFNFQAAWTTAYVASLHIAQLV
ncbi:MAG: NAD(P)/FAD-dependent oxidoreductase [Cytophagales bacterium]|nr:NAD(P)/FAD-dependent oxidoreductase [Cytophagales bacterium]MDW8385301.1 NAD(P)/FAD-dependent oxidoreductase [Flammeovirgaceae bacterium]